MSADNISPPEEKALPAPEPHLGLPEPEHKSGMRKWLIIFVILAIVAAVAWKIHANQQETAATATRTAGSADRATPVQVVSVQQKTMPIYLTALGTATAYSTVTIKTRVDGQLMRVNFREGQEVKQGALLLEIDPRPYQAALAQAQGTLARDQANAANAQAQAARYTQLYAAGVVSKESAQTQQSAAGQISGSIESDNAAIQAAKINLAYTRITSPINGVVGLRQVDPGNIVHASDSAGLLVITQVKPISVIFTLPEDQLPQVQQRMRAGQKLVVEAYDRANAIHLATGTLVTLDNQIDPTTGTDKLKAVFDNTDGSLFPNQFVNIRLILEQRQNAIVIPASALQTGTQGTFVYVVKEGNPPANPGGGGPDGAPGGNRRRAAGGPAPAPSGPPSGAPADAKPTGPQFYAEARPVKVDLTEGAQVIVSSGLQPGEQIVVDGQEKLRGGSKVSPKQANSMPTQGGADATGPNGAASPSTTEGPSRPVGAGARPGHPTPTQPPTGPAPAGTPPPGEHRHRNQQGGPPQ